MVQTTDDIPSSSTTEFTVKMEVKAEINEMHIKSSKEEGKSNSKIKEEKKSKRKRHYSSSEQEEDLGEEEEEKKEGPVDQEQLLENMREEHNLQFKSGILMGLRADENIKARIFNLHLA